MGDVLKIDYIEFPAENFDTTEAFYENVFGWKFTDYGPEYRAFTDGSLNGGFYKSELKSTSDKGAALVVLYSNNLEASLDRIEKAGGSIVMDIFDFPGGRRFHFEDPNGNQLAVWSRN